MSLFRYFSIFSAGAMLVIAAQGCATSSSDDDHAAGGDDTSGAGDLRSVKHCGGLAGLSCSSGQTCVDDPADSCDPANGGADCTGICLNAKTAAKCGGIAGLACPAGQTCVDDPTDGCDPANGGADCGGLCVKTCDPKLALTVTCMPGTQFDVQKCACVAPENKLTCATVDCKSGYHCEMKGINGGSIPVCIKDAGDCRTTGCPSGRTCQMCWATFACIPNGAMC